MRLIDADALIDKIGDRKYDITKVKGGYKYCNLEEKNDWDTLDEFEDMVDDAPTVEPQTGKWELDFEGFRVCSECKKRAMTNYMKSQELSYFCPWCGTKMDKEQT